MKRYQTIIAALGGAAIVGLATAAVVQHKALTSARDDANQWENVATRASRAFVASHNGTIPADTQIMQVAGQKEFWVVGYGNDRCAVRLVATEHGPDIRCAP